ncbi:ATP-dependent RNA helicase DDX54 [Lingula anatina]|uniref:RNA helicase n=1 Tax=Lingula anatina TaxID=7574 RepID=A0A1S3HBS9_LINAN|nr:ATP-dependent RNA helicase DDX54 [Lingula anatina]|eukprot:XP_013383468.1 ATP-dependent RNA helicase DDX54 [Lingula anatina]
MGKNKSRSLKKFQKQAVSRPKKVLKDRKASSNSTQNVRQLVTWKSKGKAKNVQNTDSELEEVTAGYEKWQVPEDVEQDSGDEETETRKMLTEQNKKKRKSGGFQSMGLSYSVYKGVTRKGYKIPTPIQRKTMPVIMDGKDVVAMARTGSGKTAAFLIPMFEKLKAHSAKSGARALIMSPTRELAVQTLKFTKELGKFTGLRSAVILGGDKMDDQFAALHENPDIIIATPGRFLHVMMEMDLKLSSVEYVVFDEADRLFEMGFQEQLQEVLKRLSDNRQTLLFSATLPKLLVDFAKAGLTDPVLIRLDVDTKLSEQLRLAFIQCRADDKVSVLLYLLHNIIQPTEQTVIFAATKHHVEYLHMILTQAGITSTYTYSDLDQTARKINVAKFQLKKCMVLLVTDLAARGIDIPLLDNVINYNFPAKPKLFVHRVGRVARAGRSGTAFSLISSDEVAYVFDLHLFLGRPLNFASMTAAESADPNPDGVYGRIPQSLVDDQDQILQIWQSTSVELEGMKKVSDNAYKGYLRSRPPASSESIKRSKQIQEQHIGIHPLFRSADAELDNLRAKLLNSMKNYRPNTTIFEVNSTARSQAFGVMKEKREKHSKVITTKRKYTEEEDGGKKGGQSVRLEACEPSTEEELKNTFAKVIVPKKYDENFKPKKKKRKTVVVKDEEFYVPYKPKDFESEKGLSVGCSFDHQAASAVLDLTGDEDSNMRKMQGHLKWDRKKKKYLRETGPGKDGTKKKIKTESGTWIAATYKSNVYKDWLERNKVLEQERGEDQESEGKTHERKGNFQVLGHKRRGRGHFGNSDRLGSNNKKRFKSELKPKEVILKHRRKKAQVQSQQKRRQRINHKNKAMAGRRGKHCQV